MRQLSTSNPHERRIEVEAIDRESMLLREEACVFGRPTGDVQHSVSVCMRAPNYARERRGFLRVILEARVDEIVELSRFTEHVTSLDVLDRHLDHRPTRYGEHAILLARLDDAEAAEVAECRKNRRTLLHPEAWKPRPLPARTAQPHRRMHMPGEHVATFVHRGMMNECERPIHHWGVDASDT